MAKNLFMGKRLDFPGRKFSGPLRRNLISLQVGKVAIKERADFIDFFGCNRSRDFSVIGLGGE